MANPSEMRTSRGASALPAKRWSLAFTIASMLIATIAMRSRKSRSLPAGACVAPMKGSRCRAVERAIATRVCTGCAAGGTRTLTPLRAERFKRPLSSVPALRHFVLSLTPMRISYPWLLTITLGFTQTVSWGVLYSAFSVIVGPMQAELGWSRGEITGAFSVALVVLAAAGVAVGQWLDRRGPRLLMTAGS